MPGLQDIIADRAIVADVLAEVEGAEARFFALIKPLVIRIVSRYMPHESDSVVNGVFIHIWARNWQVLRRWNREKRLTSYLAAVVRNFCIDRVRNRRPELVPLVPESAGTDMPDERPDANPEAMMWASKLRECLLSAYERLSETYRSLIKLRHFDGKTHQEIADSLGKTTGYVGPTLARAERYIRVELREICPDVADAVGDSAP